MINEILNYCKKNKIECIFLDFFGTIVQRNCSPEEIKYLWAKKLALELKYSIDENQLLMLRKKSEQAVSARAKAREFNYSELADEMYRRILDLNNEFGLKYDAQHFSDISHSVEVQVELMSQNYIEETIKLINEAYSKGMHIYIISDFYLGQDEIRIFLKEREIYKKIEKIFVSAECRTSKQLGGLYEYVCKQIGINAKQCIMIGDNVKTDIQNAELWGIKGFLLDNVEGESQKRKLDKAIKYISKSNVTGMLAYSNYCFLLYLYIERLYKSLIREEIKEIYFLSREGEFLKKLFDMYLNKRHEKKIHTHYLYVSRKATYPATLNTLDKENFGVLRKYPLLSISDFFENIGMTCAVSELGLTQSEVDMPIEDFFNSSFFRKLCERKDFQKLYESSRIQYNALFKRYCKQEGLITDKTIAIADVGWNGTMQDNIYNALGGLNCVGFYIGLLNSAYLSQKNKKRGLIFTENPQDSPDLELWKYDYTFLERILWASHGATDYYKKEGNLVYPIFKDYAGEKANYELMKPIQDEIQKKFVKIDSIIEKSCYCAENLYKYFLEYHLHMVYIVNNQQLNLQKKMIEGQMQNFGHIMIAGSSIRTTFSKRRILKKLWGNLRVLKNTEIMFRIFLSYNQKFIIKIVYRLCYLRLKKKKK